MPIIRHNRPVVQRMGNDIIYGTGVDGAASISSGTTILSRDMYYSSCTIASGATLFTNGFRVFCTGTLTISGTLGMPSGVTHTVGLGTVTGRVADGATGGTKTYVLGESDEGGATQVPASILKDLEHAIQGWNWDPTNGFKRFEGGSDGDDGSDTPGSPGNPGGAPPGNAPLGNPGNTGGVGGTGSGGAGGTGGGLVVVVAKTIAGTGTIVSVGIAGSAGTTGGTGAAGNPGNPGAANPDSHSPAGSGTNPPTPNPPNPPTSDGNVPNPPTSDGNVPTPPVPPIPGDPPVPGNPGDPPSGGNPVPDTPGNPYSHGAHYAPGNQDPGGVGGTGGAGGTGATGAQGKLGGIVIVTDTSSSTITGNMTLTSATYTHIDGSV